MAKILYLGPPRPEFEWVLRQWGDEVAHCEEPYKESNNVPRKYDWLVSWGYRHILDKQTVDKYAGRAINCHISYLPWNRGADPNFWSWYDDTPKGVTIHYIDQGVDTGKIIARWEVPLDGNHTLETSYNELQRAMFRLFVAIWPDIRAGYLAGTKQPAKGSYHRVGDMEQAVNGYNPLAIWGWQTRADIIEDVGRRSRLND